jgi:hypothetical protein
MPDIARRYPRGLALHHRDHILPGERHMLAQKTRTSPAGMSPRLASGPVLIAGLPALARAQRPGCWRTRDGRVVQLLVNVYENGVVFNLACVNRDGAAGKHTDGLAGG